MNDTNWRGFDAWQSGNENEFEPGERVTIVTLHFEGIFMRKDRTEWIIKVYGKLVGWRFIDHLPILDRLAEI